MIDVVYTKRKRCPFGESARRPPWSEASLFFPLALQTFGGALVQLTSKGLWFRESPGGGVKCAFAPWDPYPTLPQKRPMSHTPEQCMRGTHGLKRHDEMRTSNDCEQSSSGLVDQGLCIQQTPLAYWMDDVGCARAGV